MSTQTSDSDTPVHVPGFRAAGVACGLKPTGELDLALITSDAPCRAAAVFTTNRVKAAPVLICQHVLSRNRENIRAVVINSGCANACTGLQGIKDAKEMACSAAAAIGHDCWTGLVMSTGVIGQRLDMEKVGQGILDAAAQLSPHGWEQAARAIMTTDTRPKLFSILLSLSLEEIRDWRLEIAGIAKGAGMIHPNMATMLALLVTDAAVNAECLDRALRYAVDRSFHCITVDGDTSTNDTVLVLANGVAGNPEINDPTSSAFLAFQEGLTQVAVELAKMIVRDGEGATKFVTIHVTGAPSDAEARQVGMSVARSSLVKTAIHGEDANWGRVLAAVGYSGVAVDPERIALWLNAGETPQTAPEHALQLVKDGQGYDVDEQRAAEILAHHDVCMTIDLGLGEGQATVWTCDLSVEYVKINAEYRT
jgi:glutamate N-acetyltransferase/amino-acid N-acetyltransferase